MKTLFILSCVPETSWAVLPTIMSWNSHVLVLIGLSLSTNDVDGKYPRFIEFPDGDGNLHQVDMKAKVDTKVLKNIVRNPANNLYLLYTRRNPNNSQTLQVNNANSISSSYFNPDLPTVVVVHGWLSNQNSNLNPVIRDAYLDKNDVNVIVLDWSRLASSTYNTAVAGVPSLGRGLGQFLNFLNRITGAPFEKMHLIGFSLGAHLVGNAGRELGGRVARITGLDPAGPLWNFNGNRLSKSDGAFVEAIHTDGSVIGLGIGTAVGKVDFYPNGGNTQPGCLINVCNHNRSWQYFAATVTYNHLVGRQCGNSLQITTNTCRGNYLHMGNDILNKTGSGLYRVNTGRRYPF